MRIYDTNDGTGKMINYTTLFISNALENVYIKKWVSNVMFRAKKSAFCCITV